MSTRNVFRSVCFVVGNIYLGLLLALVAVGALGILLSEGMTQLQEIFSPFNFINWAVIGIAALPGTLLVWFGAKK